MEPFQHSKPTIHLRQLGEVIASEDGSVQAIFVGYGADGSEWWCDVVDEEHGFITKPERKTFIAARVDALEWSQDAEDFANSAGPTYADIKKPN